MVDATITFKSISQIALSEYYGHDSHFLYNMYRGWAALIIRGSQDLLYRREGAIEGNPMSMFMYAVGTVPLIQSLDNFDCCVKIWHADDASATEDQPMLCDWLNRLMRIRPRFG